MYKSLLFFSFQTCILALNLISQNINWQHFDTTTLQKAQKENKPIILHLAANWCHWCHVMEEKTYHNPKVINYINKYFIACTEDHDQRPDLANMYRDYGWPATIIFSPDGKEVFKQAGYIEANEFLKILSEIKKGKFFVKQNSPLSANSQTHSNENLKYILKDVLSGIDLNNGGFNSPQKSLDFEMFEYTLNHQNNDTLKKWLKISLENSLHLSDSVWGGIYQYSTYNDWLHPHYEKLLSIQARYIKMYLWYYYFTQDSTYLNTALKTYHYVNRFFLKNNKTFANAQDADLVKGQKAHDYYKLNETERLKLSIPNIDTNAFTDNNAKMIESLIYLYAYTRNKQFLDNAIQTTEYLLHNRKRTDGFYNHNDNNDLTPALSDQLYLTKSLFFLYRAIGSPKYQELATNLLNNIVKHFIHNNCAFNFLPIKNYISPTCVVSENIELARILNLYGKIFNNAKWLEAAQKIHRFLLSDSVYNATIIEPGIVSLNEEIHSEPFWGLYLVKDLNHKDYNLHKELLKIPLCYYYNYLMTSYNILKEKEEIWNTFDFNTVIFCTSSFCSSPLSLEKDIEQFVKIKIFKK